MRFKVAVVLKIMVLLFFSVGFTVNATALLIPAANYTQVAGEVELLENFSGMDGISVKTDEVGFIEWEVLVPKAGLYNIAVTYYPIAGRRGTIQRQLLINGEIPSEEASYLNFHRVWGDAEPPQMDNQGNQIRPSQIELPMWRRVLLQDSTGILNQPLSFYFQAGLNTIRLEARKEPMVVHSLELCPLAETLSYADKLLEYQAQQIPVTSGVFIKVQGEDAAYRSSPSLFAIHDATDLTLEPYDPALIRLNAIGGERWSTPGDWIAWEVEVPEDGLYRISIKAKQRIIRGNFVNRRLAINGQVPFKEVEAIRFPYSTRYRMVTLGPEDTEESYLFYFKKGKNIIQLDTILGDLGEILQVAQKSLYELNTIFRRVVMITSTQPDPMRDYQLLERIPEIVDSLWEQSQILDRLAQQIQDYTGQQGSHVSLLNDLSRVLARMAEDPDSIPRRLNEFRDNSGALGEWIILTKEQPLQIDYLIVSSVDQELPRAQPTFGEMVRHELNTFKASFTHDYSLIGDVHEEKETGKTLKVWIGTGRDQAQILKGMIEDSFTPNTGIRVNLELINMGILLPATLAGRGPDIAIGVPTAQPVEFAIRNAVVDLSQFPDYPEIAKRFMPSALVPFTFREQVYALPEVQSFPMLFYRKDILAELGLAVPQTWDEVLQVISELRKEHLDFGLPFSGVAQAASGALGEDTSQVALTNHGGVMTFLTLLYQQGVPLYKWDGIATNLDNRQAIQAFITWTEFYELYDVPMWYDAANRFRMGQMPILISDYQLYNMLTVFAPELRGEWDFTLIPGIVQADGSINRSVPATGTGTMMLKSGQDHEAAWEFMKWWSSAETQIRYGQELESILGPAARYATANIEASRGLPWTVEEHELLAEQREWSVGVPNVPGAYMVGRHIDNAFRQVVYNYEPPREVLLDYNRVINEEIAIKRAEFHLETDIHQLPEKWRKYLELREEGGTP